jgi:putative transposase
VVQIQFGLPTACKSLQIVANFGDLPPENESSINVRLEIKKGGISLARRQFKPEQIINKLREAEVLISQGSTIGQASRKIGITEQTYYRWRREYGGMGVEQAKRLRELEKENTRLKRLVADLSLDNAILKEAARGNF